MQVADICIGGWIGQVGQFLVDPDSGNVPHLCLRESPLWEGKQVCIPVSAIDPTREKVVYLYTDEDAVAALPTIEFRPRSWIAGSSWHQMESIFAIEVAHDA